jgi:geranylgeranyl diphosphate synthase type II
MCPRINEFKAWVEAELRRVLTREDSILFQAMRYAVLGGGKRFRPLLTLAAAESFGGSASARTAVPFAAAIELIHAYSLVHDDLPCMDDDDVRRGKLSCHKAFGDDIALLAGDALLTLAFEVMAAAEVPAGRNSRKIRVIGEVARLAGPAGMIGGQILDVTYSSEAATPESLFRLMLRKTGALITAAVRSGAILGGASGPALKAVTVFGENAGLAFQVRDDIHDAETRGKSRVGRSGRGADEPNFARFVGKGEARKRLATLVRGAIEALDEIPVRTVLLRRLVRELRMGHPS